MRTESEWKDLIMRIRATESPEFECDEGALLKEYALQQSNRAGIGIKIVSILGGIFAANTFLGFLALAGIISSGVGMLIAGIVATSVSLFVNISYNKLFFDTFSVASYIVGLSLMAYGLFELDLHFDLVALTMGLIALGTMRLTQNYLMSFIAFAVLLASIYSPPFYHSFYYGMQLFIILLAVGIWYCFNHESELIASRGILSRLYDPIRTSLVLAFLLILSTVGNIYLIPEMVSTRWHVSVFIIFLDLYILYGLTNLLQLAEKERILILLLSLIILGLTAWSPAISGSLLIILYSFRNAYRTGLVAGSLALVYYISQFYYDLELSLLIKSILLMVSGFMFFLLYFLYRNRLRIHE